MSRFSQYPGFLLLVCLTLSPTLSGSQEEGAKASAPWKLFPELFQARAKEFPEVSVTEGSDPPGQFEANLRNAAFVLPDGRQGSAVRFRAPRTPYLDLVWALSLPDSWCQFGCIRVADHAGQEEKDNDEGYFAGDRAYISPTTPAGHSLFLQSIRYKRFTPGEEHLIWFVKNQADDSPALLRAVIHFTRWQRDNEATPWNPSTIESTLRLRPASAAEDAAVLRTRGGQILLDPQFFDRPYAEDRIRALTATLRDRLMTGDQPQPAPPPQVPVSPTHPSLLAIQKAYGEPDLSVSARERSLINAHWPPEERRLTRAWYDRFAFVYAEADPAKAILWVETSAFNFVDSRPRAAGLTYVSLSNFALPITLFFKDRREIARISRLGSANSKILSGILALGTYEQLIQPGNKEELTYLGKGAWTYRWITPESDPHRTATLKDHAYDGPMIDYHPDKTEAGRMNFKKGLLIQSASSAESGP